MNHQHPATLNGRDLLEALDADADLAELRHANLDSCGLTCIPDHVLTLTSLATLSLFDNRLTDLPSVLSQWRSLQVLNLGQNLLTAVPEAIGALTNLRMLDLERFPI